MPGGKRGAKDKQQEGGKNDKRGLLDLVKTGLDTVHDAGKSAKNKISDRARKHRRRRKARKARKAARPPQPVNLFTGISPDEIAEHDRGGSVSIDLLVAMTVQGDDTQREVVRNKIPSLSKRALQRYSQTVTDKWRMTRSTTEKEREDALKKRIKEKKKELDAAKSHSDTVRKAAKQLPKANMYLKKTEALEKTRKAETEADVAIKIAHLKGADLEKIEKTIRSAGVQVDKKDAALQKIETRKQKLVAGIVKRSEERNSLRDEISSLQGQRASLPLGSGDEQAIDDYTQAKFEETRIASELAHLMEQQSESPTGQIGELISLANELAEKRARTEGSALGVGLANFSASTKLEEKSDHHYTAYLTTGGAKSENALGEEATSDSGAQEGTTQEGESQQGESQQGESHEAGTQDAGTQEGDTSSTEDGATAEEELYEYEFGLTEEVAEVNQSMRNIEVEKRKGGLTADDEARLRLVEEKQEELIRARTGISSQEAEAKKSWKLKDFKTYLDCRAAHLDLQVELLRASVEAKGYGQVDRNNLGVAGGAQLDLALQVVGAKVAAHSTPYEFELFGERFVLSGAAVLDAGIAASLAVKGEGAVALGHHASGPTANLSAEAKAFAGAKAGVAGAFALDWNVKGRGEYARLLGKNFGRFLKYMGLQETQVEAPDEVALELFDDMKLGTVGDVLITSIEARVDGKVGAGAEAVAQVGFSSGVVNLKASFGITLGAGFSTDVALRIGVVDGARLAAIIFTRAGKKIYEGATFALNWARENAMPAIKKWLLKTRGKMDARTKAFRDKLQEVIHGSREEVAVDPDLQLAIQQALEDDED